MVPVKQDQERAHGRWEEQKAILGEAVWIQGTIPISGPNTVVIILIVTVQNPEVDV